MDVGVWLNQELKRWMEECQIIQLQDPIHSSGAKFKVTCYWKIPDWDSQPSQASLSPKGPLQSSSSAPRVSHPISLSWPFSHTPLWIPTRPLEIFVITFYFCAFSYLFSRPTVCFIPCHYLTSYAIFKFLLVHFLTIHQRLGWLMSTEFKMDNVNPHWTVSCLSHVFYWSALESVFWREQGSCLSPESSTGPCARGAYSRVWKLKVMCYFCCYLILMPFTILIWTPYALAWNLLIGRGQGS